RSSTADPFTVDGGAFDVMQGVVASLQVQTQPGAGTAGSAIPTQPVVRLVDGDGNVETAATNTVTAVIKGGTGRYGAVLAGTTSVSAAAGVATFTNLQV